MWEIVEKVIYKNGQDGEVLFAFWQVRHADERLFISMTEAGAEWLAGMLNTYPGTCEEETIS